MSGFREHKSTSDRSATDRRRHKQKINKAIKDGIQHIVADESIIGKDGKKKILIPVKGIKEYRFIYGDGSHNKQVASAPGKNIKKGQKVGQARKKASGAPGRQAGNERGEEFYEVELTLEELAEYLFENLELPELEKKKFRFVTEKKPKWRGHRTQGLRNRLSKKLTIKSRIKRKLAAKRNGTYDEESEERFPFHDDDLKYKHYKSKPKENSSAVVFFIMDVSGSMSTQKKYLARSFYFLVYQFLRYKYDNIEIVFISHTIRAKEVSEEEFFSRSPSGGTLISPALELMNDIVEKRFHTSMWNIYGFHCSDGDNWPEDHEKCLIETKKIIEKCQVYSFCEITPEEESFGNEFSETFNNYKPLVSKSFKLLKINLSSDIWLSFKKIFGVKNV
jgi:sporulation protein YhbH